MVGTKLKKKSTLTHYNIKILKNCNMRIFKLKQMGLLPLGKNIILVQIPKDHIFSSGSKPSLWLKF